METDASGALGIGYAEIRATAPIGGTLLFSSRNSAGTTTAETGVGASLLLTHFKVPILVEPGLSNTGIAFANTSRTSIQLTLTLHRPDGQIIGSRSLNLSPGEHVPRFASEFFSEIPAQQAFNGFIQVVASEAVAAIALKQSGALLTTFPVVPEWRAQNSLPAIVLLLASCVWSQAVALSVARKAIQQRDFTFEANRRTGGFELPLPGRGRAGEGSGSRTTAYRSVWEARRRVSSSNLSDRSLPLDPAASKRPPPGATTFEAEPRRNGTPALPTSGASFTATFTRVLMPGFTVGMGNSSTTSLSSPLETCLRSRCGLRG